MKKIFFYLCFFSIFGCAGYEPLFSTKNLSFYIEDIKNVNNDIITEKISKNIDNNKLKSDNNIVYLLEIESDIINNISSKDSKGNPLTYNMVLDVKVKVFNRNTEVLINTLRFNKSFSYNNQTNKFNFNEYKKTIIENITDKISQEILISLQSL
jgi:outer membrane lipopolysaccharide assembly protein LptE/RlpB|tara:strand:- start:262 stop:723 length:462 start_codon:yes stop_codon:yes gene_type:complete